VTKQPKDVGASVRARLLHLAREHGALLVCATRATFERRKTPLPVGLPTDLTNEFATDPGKATQWTAFGRKSGARDAPDLQTTIATIVAFAEGPLAAAARGLPFSGTWLPGGHSRLILRLAPELTPFLGQATCPLVVPLENGL
jgi:hypothetical protein